MRALVQVQREAALVQATTDLAGRAAAGEHRAVVAEAQVDMAEGEVDMLEDLAMTNNAAIDRLLGRMNAKFNRMYEEDRLRWQGWLEEERRLSADLDAALARAEGQVRRAERRARQADRRANDQAWDAVRARAAAAAAVSLLGPVVVD